MSVSAIVLICLAALLCGAALAVLVVSHLSSRQKALLYEAQERVDELEKLLSDSQSACQVLQTKNDMLLSSREDDSKRYETALNAQKSQFDTVLAAQQAKFDETVGKMTAQLKAATEDMLKQRQKEFSDSSRENIGQVVTPLKETIEKMKDGVILVNTSRGGLIKTSDLIAGIRDHKFFAVGLDVYEEETAFFFEDFSENIHRDQLLSLLLSMPNVLLTSHQAFLTNEALKNIAEVTLQNLADFFDGKPLKNEVKTSQL